MVQETARLFIALDFDAATKERIALIQNTLRQSQSLKASWVAEDNFHLTLKFLGDTPKNKLPIITDVITGACKDIQRIPCTITEAGSFPPHHCPRVVWVGIEHGNDEISALAHAVENALSKIGFKKEKRAFASHITIARVKNMLNYRDFQKTLSAVNENFQPISFTFETVTIFESTLTPTGPLYKGLSRLSLA